MKKTTILILTVLLIGITAPYIWAGWNEKPLDDRVRQQAPGDFVSLTDGKIHYLWQGAEDGEIIVLLHGVSVPHYVFAQAASALEDVDVVCHWLWRIMA